MQKTFQKKKISSNKNGICALIYLIYVAHAANPISSVFVLKN